ncbi:MAG TPA: hypothetical protein VIK73_11195 [Limnochordales bacterium]
MVGYRLGSMRLGWSLAGWRLALLVALVVAPVLGATGTPVASAEGAASAPAIADVPPDHWAYQAVVTLVQRGYVTLQAGRFDGTRPVDRFTLASVVARLLQDVERGQVRLTGDDLQLVRQLTNEFRTELARWQEQRAQLADRLDGQAREVARIDAKLTDVLQYATEVDQRLTQATDALSQQLGQATQALNQQLSMVSQRLTQVESVARGLGTVIQDLQTRLHDLGEEMALVDADLRNQLAQLGAADKEASQRLQASAGEIQALRSTLQSLQQSLEGQRQRSDEWTSQVGQLDQQLKAVAASLDSVRKEVASLQASLDRERARTDEIIRSLVWEGGATDKLPSELLTQVEQLRTQNRWLMAASLAGVVLAVAALLL